MTHEIRINDGGGDVVDTRLQSEIKDCFQSLKNTTMHFPFEITLGRGNLFFYPKDIFP